MNVIYNRSKREYEVLDIQNNTVSTFPCGHKQEAVRFAVSLLYPDLFNIATSIIKAHPQTGRRVWRAVDYVIGGKVENVGGDNVLALVHGSQPYQITQKNNVLVCECPDYFEGGLFILEKNTGKIRQCCKHVLAYEICKQIYLS